MVVIVDFKGIARLAPRLNETAATKPKEPAMSRIATPATLDGSPSDSQPLHAAARAEYDGLCAVAVSMGERVPSDASSTSQHAGRTFRFSSPEAKAMFDADPATFAAKADVRWPQLG